MSAEAHRQEAAEHDRKAGEAERRYEEETRTGAPYDDRARYPQEFESYDPRAAYLDFASEHRRQAREHLETARALEKFEEAECGAFPPESRVVCPLLGQVEAIEDVPGGVRVRLEEDVPLRAAVAHMRCHLAFARARGRTGMRECPLYLRGERVEPVPRLHSVDLIVDDPADLEALRLRTHRHLEQ